ncbi:MAG TPA: hypothetical protein DCY10_03420 [Clostridiales bacterium]|nr:hypothetical protein [Clostridiales bacterium]
MLSADESTIAVRPSTAPASTNPPSASAPSFSRLCKLPFAGTSSRSAPLVSMEPVAAIQAVFRPRISPFCIIHSSRISQKTAKIYCSIFSRYSMVGYSSEKQTSVSALAEPETPIIRTTSIRLSASRTDCTICRIVLYA